ncbi:MAG: hypothetical protein K9K93_02990 [Acholeplasmataceae bacterium]|nr:hypothetical protein [Acholeplasmataceae bacterium]
MAQFNVHFFKEKNKDIDFDQIRMFFDRIEGFSESFDDVAARFEYTHPRLGYQSAFVVTPKTQVPDIYRLSPKFLDVNFHLEMPVLTPDYVAKQVFEIVRSIAETFSLHIYNQMFEDVLPYRQNVLMKVFQMVKEAYIGKNPILLKDYHVLPKDKLAHILRYLDDQLELQKYYKDLETYVPRYHFLNHDQTLMIGIEWKDQTLTLFPPQIDVIFYRINDEIRVIPYEPARKLMEKHLEDVPGFIKGTKVVPRKNARKVFKIMRKSAFDIIGQTYTKETVMRLLD